LRQNGQQRMSDMQGVFYGSDGTRTRDLRRDRPAQRGTSGN
jgi:hypothetical protein